MAENSAIEWTTHTFNPWRGCEHAGPGCDHCYAEAMAKRNPGTLGTWGDNGTRVVGGEPYWRLPLKWNEAAACIQSFDCSAGDHSDACPQKIRPRVFCASLADVFEDWGGVMFSPGKQPVILNKKYRASNGTIAERLTMADVRQRLFALIDATPNLDWLLVTKRPENIERMWWAVDTRELPRPKPIYRPNVWLLTSIATQADADRNIPELLKCRDLVPVLGLSAEPLLGPIDLVPSIGFLNFGHAAAKYLERMSGVPRIDWVIVGGESGPNSRACLVEDGNSIVDQCRAAGVPAFRKQLGSVVVVDYYTDDESLREWALSGRYEVLEPTRDGWYVRDDDRDRYQPPPGTRIRVRLKDKKGGDWNEWPEDLRVREYPTSEVR